MTLQQHLLTNLGPKRREWHRALVQEPHRRAVNFRYRTMHHPQASVLGILPTTATSMMTTIPLLGLTTNPIILQHPNQPSLVRNSMRKEIVFIIPRCACKNVDLTSGTYFTNIVPYVVVVIIIVLRMEMGEALARRVVTGAILLLGLFDRSIKILFPRRIIEEDLYQGYVPCRRESFVP